MKLSVELEKWRAGRPDEWKMDEFIRNAAKIESENDALSQKLRAAQHESEALAATVEALRKSNSDLLAYTLDAEKWFNKHDPNGYVSPKRGIAQQHLRDVRAEAVIDAIKKSVVVVCFDVPCVSVSALRKYAESVKAGEV